MIGKLSGIVDSVGADHAVVDVGGVGYLVHCPVSTLARLSVGAAVQLAIETKVSDEAIRLYGFLTAEDREWFRLLQTVQGVGTRVALSILSTLKIPELERAVLLGDKAPVGRAPGVGPKLAGRIVAELKDKLPADLQRYPAGQGVAGAVRGSPRPVESDAIAALVKLGYPQFVAAEAVARAGRNLGPEAGNVELDVLLRETLRQLAR